MSALRSFDAWFVAHEIIADLPAAFKAEREAGGWSIAGAARQMTGMTAYRLRKFEDGNGATDMDLRAILLWMAGARTQHPADPSPVMCTHDGGEWPDLSTCADCGATLKPDEWEQATP